MADEKSRGTGWRAGITGAVLMLVVVAAVAGVAHVMGWRAAYEPSPAQCTVDDAVDSGMRQALGDSAIAFVTAISGSNPIAAYGMLTAEAKGAVAPDKFLAALRPSLEAVAPFSNFHVEHVYFVRGTAGDRNQRVICGSLDQPDHWVAVSAKPVPRQAHLLVDAAGKTGHWIFALWLVPEDGWRVQGFDFGATAMAGKSLTELIAAADAQHNQHHDFNAVMLYNSARRLAARGNDLQLGLESEIEERIAKLPIPAFLQGKPPLNWKIGDNKYKIDNIGAAGAGDKLYLTLTWELTPWLGDKDADTRNRVLIRDFVKAVPEYAAAFGGLILVARDPVGGNVFRTVATNQAEATATPTKK